MKRTRGLPDLSGIARALTTDDVGAPKPKRTRSSAAAAAGDKSTMGALAGATGSFNPNKSHMLMQNDPDMASIMQGIRSTIGGGGPGVSAMAGMPGFDGASAPTQFDSNRMANIQKVWMLYDTFPEDLKKLPMPNLDHMPDGAIDEFLKKAKHVVGTAGIGGVNTGMIREGVMMAEEFLQENTTWKVAGIADRLQRNPGFIHAVQEVMVDKAVHAYAEPHWRALWYAGKEIYEMHSLNTVREQQERVMDASVTVQGELEALEKEFDALANDGEIEKNIDVLD